MIIRMLNDLGENLNKKETKMEIENNQKAVRNEEYNNWNEDYRESTVD
mgnify:CR=1 FL=1